jgi:hypothetical protein
MGHLIPLLEGGLIFAALEVFLWKPVFLVYVAAAITVLIILGMLAPKQRFLDIVEFWHYIFNPLIFAWSAILLLLFFENIYFKHLFVLGIAVYIIFYFENLFYYLSSGKEKNEDNFSRAANIMNVVSIFFLAAGLYGVKTFIQLPVWMLGIIFFIFSGALVYGALWIVKPVFRDIFWEILVVSLIITELFVALNFWPIGFYADGAVLGILYYIIAGILVNFLKKGVAPYKRYLIIGSILLLAVLATAKWM